MSRPVSVEDLILQNLEAAKPKFVSRKQRNLRKEASKPAKSTNPLDSSVPNKRSQEDDQPQKVPEPAKKKPLRKYAFDWDLEDDTSSEYAPLVTVDVSKPRNQVLKSEKHWSQKPLDQMTARDWRIFKDDYNITSKGGDLPNPLRLWEENPQLPAKLVDILKNTLNYQEPTPIQRAAIPLALEHRDVVGIAETGSGKTLAFLLPLLTYITNIEPEYMKYEHSQEINSNKTLGLILAPTRELALQISAECQKFTKPLGLSVVTIIGGHQYEETVHSLQNGVHIVVATPGRLIDSLERGLISLEKCYHLIMDEADKMIDMGFEKSLQQILGYLPTSDHLLSSLDTRIFRIKKRTTLMFTATITPAIEKITKNYLVDPGYLYIGNANELVDNIEQKFEYLGETPGDKQTVDPKRLRRLVNVLEQHKKKGAFSVIIFANYRNVVEQLADELAERNFGGVAVIHGSKNQEARERAIKSFRAKESSVLIATDVAARGIDVPHVSMVVNFQMSNKFEEYIHRIGRTGRAGQQGESFTFIDDGDSETFQGLKKFLSRGGYKIPEWLYSATRI
ncbi:CIC11C00000005070 [Sungouiella intermedia]|uniref:RNA helicase n=1 Tax=Sungouiella intermedia TaxID=45354 RepID=A0A1L0BFY4_9ASCO|nr:CIC11C00000005070 [[Candida] intermedia]